MFDAIKEILTLEKEFTETEIKDYKKIWFTYKHFNRF